MYADMEWWKCIRQEVLRGETSKREILRREGIHRETLKKVLEHSLLRETHERQRLNIINRFPEITQCPHKHFLSLNKYLVSSP